MGLCHNAKLRCVITASTGGAVMNECLRYPLFKSLIHSVVCDQHCGAAEKAHAHGIPAVVFDDAHSNEFCTRLLDYVQGHQIDYVFSFYTKFYSEAIRKACADRIVNFHPSLLPAFKGNDAWEYVKVYGVRFMGSTVEFIHERMDEGKIILQAVCPWDPNQSEARNRHRIFIQQCKSLLQVAQWLAERRISTDGCHVIIRNARFDSPEYSPALDSTDALQFTCLAPFGCL